MGGYPRPHSAEMALRSKHHLNVKIFTDELTAYEMNPTQAFFFA